MVQRENVKAMLRIDLNKRRERAARKTWALRARRAPRPGEEIVLAPRHRAALLRIRDERAPSRSAPDPSLDPRDPSLFSAV